MQILIYYRKMVLPQILTYMHVQGITVSMYPLGTDAVLKHTTKRPDMIVIDTTYSIGADTDVSFVRNLQTVWKDTPIILATNQIEKFAYREAMLNAGVDVCVQVPFLDTELQLRIEKLLARRTVPLFSGTQVTVNDLSVDLKSHGVTHDGVPVQLTKVEYGMLFHFFFNKNRVVKSKELDAYLYKAKEDSSAVNVHILNLRRKLRNSCTIKTVPRYGFVMTDA